MADKSEAMKEFLRRFGPDPNIGPKRTAPGFNNPYGPSTGDGAMNTDKEGSKNYILPSVDSPDFFREKANRYGPANKRA